MAVIVKNESVARGVYLMRLEGLEGVNGYYASADGFSSSASSVFNGCGGGPALVRGAAGRFVQVHMPDGSMPLPRPISLFDADCDGIELAYRIVGRGTALMSRMRAGDSVRVTGALGNGFPLVRENVVLIGGGLGVAPLHLLARSLRRYSPNSKITVALGFGECDFLLDTYKEFADDIIVDIGGFITDRVDFDRDAVYYACGPAPMMRAAAVCAHKYNKRLFVSFESRMACGVGACYSCSIKTRLGNRRVCKDGPVFEAWDIYGDIYGWEGKCDE